MTTPTIHEFATGLVAKGEPCPVCGKTVRRVVFRRDTYYAVHDDKSECVLIVVKQTGKES